MKKILFLSVLFALSSCAHYPDVRPGENGVNRVVVVGKDRQGVVQSALRQAKSFCSESKRAAIFLNEDVKYTGALDESTHVLFGKASKVAVAVGSVMGASSTSDKQRKDSGVVAGSGILGGAALEDENAYTSTMTFKCN